MNKHRFLANTRFRVNSLSIRVVTIILVSIVLISTVWFLWTAPKEFPIDDTYIHFVYANNFVEWNELFFNYPDEAGIGTSSPLWVFLLAIGHKMGLSIHILAKVLGIVSLIFVGVGLNELLRSNWKPVPALISTLFVVLSGHMLWFALSGMETMIFLALGILSLLLYRAEKWGWLGVVLGLLFITRIEGILLAVAIFMVDLLYRRRIHNGLLILGLGTVFIGGIWIVYLYSRTGMMIPTSGGGKIFSLRLGSRMVVERIKYLAIFGKYPSLMYPFLWLIYLLEFVLGGMGLPPPHIPVGVLFGNPDFTYSIWAVLGLVGIVIPLIWAFSKRLGKPEKWTDWLNQDNRRPMLIFMVWIVLHNLVYMIILPIPGTASRYGAINHIAVWLVLVIGLFSIVKRTRFWIWFVVGLCSIAVLNTMYWKGVYAANLEHMKNVRIKAADYIRESLGQDYLCAAFDIGALRYFVDDPIIDIGGLVDPSLIDLYIQGDLDKYLISHNVNCLAIPGRMGTTKDGWFDFINILGLSTSPLFEIEQSALFEIDRETWLKGYLPTGNYQATITIYELTKSEPHD